MTDEQAFDMIVQRIEAKCNAEADLYFDQGYAQTEGVKRARVSLPSPMYICIWT